MLPRHLVGRSTLGRGLVEVTKCYLVIFLVVHLGLSLISVSIWSIGAFSGVERTGRLLECLGLLPSLWPIIRHPTVL